MFGLNEALMSFIRRQVGLRTDVASANGSLHGKLNMYLTAGVVPGISYIQLGFLGDKSDGDFTPATNQTLTKPFYSWGTVNIPAGVTITTMPPGVFIFAEDITIGGLLTASGKGAAGGAAYTSDQYQNGIPGGNGAGYLGGGGGSGGGSSNRAGNGGNGQALGGIGGSGAGVPGGNAWLEAMTFDHTLLRGLAGGGGGSGYQHDGTNGAGGAGGGYIIIYCNNLTILPGGAIRADGLNGGNATGIDCCGGGGGGGGAVIIFYTGSLTNDGIISAAGGAGGNGSGSYGYRGGNGGAGLVFTLKLPG